MESKTTYARKSSGTSREQPISSPGDMNQPVGPRPRQWGYGLVKRCSDWADHAVASGAVFTSKEGAEGQNGRAAVPSPRAR
eukprot:9012600-Pyramimonas_sp.AAC.1